MVKKHKAVIMLLAILSVIFLAGNIILYKIGSKEKQMRYDVEKKLLNTVDQKRNLEEVLREIKKEKERLSLELDVKSTELTTVRQNLTEASELKDVYYQELQTEIESKQQLEDELSNKEGAIESLEEQNAALQERYVKLKGFMQDIIQTKEKLQEKLNNIIRSNNIQLKDIVVSPETEEEDFAGEVPDMEYKLLLVNAEYSFVIINKGRDDGIKTGLKFSVKRSGKQIALLEVDKLYAHMASAAIVQSRGKTIKLGDAVELVRP